MKSSNSFPRHRRRRCRLDDGDDLPQQLTELFAFFGEHLALRIV
jgi:hypothetical protein